MSPGPKPAKKGMRASTETGTKFKAFTDEEREAMKERARE